MSSWRKLLARMAADRKPTGYTYDDAATVLARLGFTLASRSGTSHRKWRREVPGKPTVIIGLVDRGNGPIRPVYIVEMIRILRENDLLPERGE
jgi:hypothetical protein